MVASKPFSQYLAEAKARKGGQAKSVTLAPGSIKGANPAMDALSTFVDILSRPMRAVENIPNTIFDEMAKAQDAEKAGTQFDLAGAIGNVLTSPVRGLFSTNPADQPTGAQLIEKGTDVIGGINSPNYKDVQDNVNPWIKGIGGFGLDVGLDPLTYIPGAQLAKGAQIVGKGIKEAAIGADALVAGTNLGKAIGSGQRIASRAAKAADAAKAENAAFLAQRAAQPAMLQNTAFGARVAPPVSEAQIAASDIIRGLNKIETPTIATPKLTEGLFSQAIGPATKTQAKASTRLAEAMKATDLVAPEVTAAKTASGIDEAALMDSVGGPIGSSVREQFAATGKVPDIVAQLEQIKPGITTIAAKNPVALTETSDNVAQQIRSLEEQITTIKKRTAGTTSTTALDRADNAVASLQSQIKALKVSQKKVPTTPVAEQVSQRSFSASTALKGILADPVKAQALKDTLGESVVTGLAKIKSPQTLMRATEHLGKVIRGEASTGSAVQKQLAQDLQKHYDIKVPGTEVPATNGVSLVDTELTAEAQVAKAADQNIQEVPWLGGYTKPQIDAIIRDMPEYLKSDFLNVEGYRYKTLTGALSTSDVLGEGVHKYPYEFNQMDQYSLVEALIRGDRKAISAANDAARAAGDYNAVTAGIQRANLLKFASLKKVELALRWLDTKGASAWMGVGKDRVRLYTHQMLSELNNTSRALGLDDTLDIALFNSATSVPITNIMDAVVALYKNPAMKEADVLKILKTPIKGADNFLTTKEPALWRHYFAKPKGLFKENYKEGKLKGYYGLVDPNEFGKQLAKVLQQSAPTMEKVVLHNEEMALSRTIAESKDLSESVIKSIFDDANDPAAFDKLIREIADTPVFVSNKGASNYVKPQLDPIVGKPATDYWPNDVVHDGQHIQNLVKAASKDPKVAREALTKLGVSNAAYEGKSAEEIIALMGSRFDGVTTDGRVVNEAYFNDAVNEMAFNNMLQAGRVAKIKELMQYGSGSGQIIHKFDQANIQLSKGLADFKLNINRVAKAHAGLIPGTETTVLAQALRDIAGGAKSTTPAIAAARADLEPLVWSVFGNPKDGPYAMGIWERSGGTLEDLQVYMKKAKLDYVVDMAAASEKAIKDGTSQVAAGIQDWTRWADTVDDPLKFLADMHWAGSMLHVDKTAAQLFVARAGVTSSKPMAGYSRIPDLNLFEHPLMGHMPKNTFIRDDILQEVNNLEKTIMADYSPKSPFGKFLNEKYLPVLGAWKKGVTIYRPGHHVRNLLSSEGIQWTVEGNKYYMRSMNAAMKTLMKHKSYEGVDWAQTVSELDTLRMPTGGDMLFSFGNKKITVDALYEAAEKHGLFTDFRMVEDLFATDNASKFSQVIDRATLKDTAVERLAGGVSEYQAHFSRLHHFSQILMKQGGKGRNWEQAVEAAAKKVRRHHPDGMTLTPFERAYIKPLIPFYSWFRQVIPVIAEGIWQNPGRFMVYPKASYNLAVAMGVDPQSLQNPFPANQLFPSFVTDQLTGPVAQINGNYFTAQPGYAYADILNQFVADPKRGLISMVTPFIKTPGELITGTKWDTGVSIKDYSDYIDSQIPGINYLSNFTGVSTTGSVASLLSGQGIDTQYAVSKGNKTVLDQGLSVSNWFTGLGLQNVSKENYVNFAEIEKRNAAKAAADRAAGTARSPF